MLADLLDRMTRADQLALGGCVDAVVTRAGDGRRGDPEVHLLGTCLADQLDQGAAGGAADDGVVHDHDLLALEHLAHRRSESTRLNSSHSQISYAVFCLKKKNKSSTM